MSRILIAAVVVASLTIAATYVTRKTHSYPELTDVTRIGITTNKGSWGVCDPATVRRFVDVMNHYRQGWRDNYFYQEAATNYGIVFGKRGDHFPNLGVYITPGFVYRRMDSTLAFHKDPAAVWSAFLPLIEGVVSDPTIPKFTAANIKVGPPRGYWCD